MEKMRHNFAPLENEIIRYFDNPIPNLMSVLWLNSEFSTVFAEEDCVHLFPCTPKRYVISTATELAINQSISMTQ